MKSHRINLPECNELSVYDIPTTKIIKVSKAFRTPGGTYFVGVDGKFYSPRLTSRQAMIDLTLPDYFTVKAALKLGVITAVQYRAIEAKRKRSDDYYDHKEAHRKIMEGLQTLGVKLNPKQQNIIDNAFRKSAR